MSSVGPWIGRRALTALAFAAALCASPVATPLLTAEPPRFTASEDAGRNARPLGAAHVADLARSASRRSCARRAITGSTRCSCRCAAAATRTSSAASSRGPPISSASRSRSIRSRTVIDRAHAAGPARARVDQRQPRVERRRSAGRARAPRLPASAVAHGAARHRAGDGHDRSREPGVRRQARALDAHAVGRDRGALRVADRARGGRLHRVDRRRHRAPLRPRRRALRLRALPHRALRLQRRRHPRVPRLGAPGADRRGAPRARRPGDGGPLRVSGRDARRVARLSRRAHDGADVAPGRARSGASAPTRSCRSRPRPTCARRSNTGCRTGARWLERRPRRRALPDGLHARAGAFRRADRRRAAGCRRPRRCGPASARIACRRRRRSRTSRPRAASARPASSSSRTTA